MENNLKEARQNAKLSLRKLGEMAGCSYAHLHLLETNESNPTLRLAYAVSKVLGLSVYDIWPDTTEIVEETITIRRVKHA